MWFDMSRARRKFHLFSKLRFYLPLFITNSDDNLNQSSVNPVEVSIFAFNPHLLFVVPKAALGQGLLECSFLVHPLCIHCNAFTLHANLRYLCPPAV